MIVKLKISDETYEQYVTKFGVQGADNTMQRAIEAYKDVDKSDRVVLLGGDARRAIEAVFQTTIDSPEKLLTLVQNMARVHIGDVHVDFTTDQLERLQAQAGFYGRTLLEYMKEQVNEIKSAMLEKV